MAIITIARQLGAGGGQVAVRLAETLGWRLLDRALVERIAEEMQAAPEAVELHNERVESFVERLGQYLSEGFPEVLQVPSRPPVSPDRTARAARRVVETVAAEGPAVIVGHGAQCILQGRSDALHVLLHAPRSHRVRIAAQRFGVGEEEADARVRDADSNRSRYVREHFGREWLDPELYHLSIDTARFGTEGSASIIERVAREALLHA
jgi:cytidylate kinase